MKIRILIIGLPGSGKTTLAKFLTKKLNAYWINADKVRKRYNDWDFSKIGVLRQAKRMAALSKKIKRKFVIADFVCPFSKGRKIYNADFLIWMNTIKKGRLSTFDKTFQAPKKVDVIIKKKNAKISVNAITKKIKKKFNLTNLGKK